jgi:hypothetical protein
MGDFLLLCVSAGRQHRERHQRSGGEQDGFHQ